MAKSPLDRVMLGFIVRRFVAQEGHEPTAAQFAEWANNYREGDKQVCLFGKKITTAEAAVILKHRGREVSTKNPRPHEASPEAETERLPSNVTSMAEARERLARRRNRR